MHNLPLRRRDLDGRGMNGDFQGRRFVDGQSPFPPDGRARNHPHTQRSTADRRPMESLSLEDGITELYDSVNDAIQYFFHFDQDFRQDTQRIRAYCDKNLLEAVWTSKVHPQTQSQHNRRGQFDVEGSHDRSSPASATFRSTIKQLLKALGVVVTAAEEFRPSQRRPSRYTSDDAAKIRQQLQRSFQNLRRSFAIVMQRRLEMETVNTELEMLRVFLSRNGAEVADDRVRRGHVRGEGERHQKVEFDMQGEEVYEEEGGQSQEWGAAPEQAQDGGGGDAQW
ncbi:MAG: hypothetical protein LQ338_002065 [Usnochroma carphineum]|nr:MAG: hypothetical protein LQ338_002065 [Usnochroma carphineum]